MKANRSALFSASATCALLLLLCSCVEPVPTPVALVPPALISPAPPPPPTDWHDMPATAGTWRWANEGGVSVARFTSLQQLTLLSLTCDLPTRTITVTLAGEDHAGVAPTLAISTTSLSRTLALPPAPGGIALAARDPLLDAMAFSRGRFAVEVPGSAALYLPSWPEVGRVIEDCRQPSAAPQPRHVPIRDTDNPLGTGPE